MKEIVSQMMIVLLLVGMSTSTLNIHPVKAIPTAIIVSDNYATIQGAINAASDGDTVFVRNGTYFEHVLVNKPVSLIAESKSAIVDGGGNGTTFAVGASNVRVSGFTIQNTPNTKKRLL